MKSDGSDSKVLESVHKKFNKVGFVLPGKPIVDCEDIPLELTNESTNSLIQFMALYTAWADFADGQESVSENEVEVLQTAYDSLVAAKLLTVNIFDYPSLTDRKAIVQNMDEVTELRHGLLEKKIYRRLVKKMIKVYERRTATISRELTKRLGRTADE